MVLSKSNVPGVVDLEDRDHIVAGAYREERGAVVPGGRFATDADRAECDSDEAPEVDHSKEQSGWLGTLLSGRFGGLPSMSGQRAKGIRQHVSKRG